MLMTWWKYYISTTFHPVWEWCLYLVIYVMLMTFRQGSGWSTWHFLKIGLNVCFQKWCLVSLTHLTSTSPKSNHNGWWTLLCLSVAIGEHGLDLISDEIKCMYYLKRNGLDKGRVYVSWVIGYWLHLKLTYSSRGGKINISTSLQYLEPLLQHDLTSCK